MEAIPQNNQTYPTRKILSNGAKAVQRTDDVDRAKEYKDAVRVAGCGQDVDLVLYNKTPQGIRYVGVFEITQREPHPLYTYAGENYLQSILNRYRNDMQGTIACDMAKRFGCHAFIVVYDTGCGAFWVYDLTIDKGWKHHDSLDAHTAWIRKLRTNYQ
jgi:hypothetical protein